MRSIFGVAAIGVAVAMSALTPSLAAWTNKEREDATSRCSRSLDLTGGHDTRWTTLCECMIRGFEEAYPNRQEFERVDVEDAKYKALSAKLWASCPFTHK